MQRVCIYHIKRADFSGRWLYPLNRLKDKLPAVYEDAVKKYAGREWLMGVKLPTLGCLWNDVLHFSLMHPALIFKHLSDVGIDYSKRELRWLEIPLRDAIAQPCVLYKNTRQDRSSREYPESDFEPVSSERIRELSGMPERNLRYYRECVEQKTYPLLWGYAPHVLVKGEFDVSGYRTFDWRDQGE